MNLKVLRLEVKNLRGIRYADLPLESANLVLVGENGAGKSSFVDALEYLFTGSIERLCRQDVKERQSLPFLGCDHKEVGVALSCQIDGVECVFKTGYPYSEPKLTKAAQTWWKQIRARPPILRRAQILKFIEDRGADRYKQISTLIGLDEVDAILDAWRSLKNEWQRKAQEHRQSLTRKEQEATELGILDRRRQLTLEAVNQRLQAVDLAPVADIIEIKDRLTALQEKSTEADVARRITALEHDCAQVQDMSEKFARFVRAYHSFCELCHDFVSAREGLKEALFHDLLEQSARLLETHEEIEVCPVCQQPINREHLLQTLRHRLESLAEVQQKRTALQTRRDAVSDAIGDVLISAEPVESLVPGYPDGLRETLLALRAMLRDTAFFDNPPLVPVALADPEPSLQAQMQQIHAEIARLQPSESRQMYMEVAIYLQNVLDVWREFAQVRQQLVQAEKAAHYLGDMETALLQARQRRLEEIHSEIANTINDYFSRLHPKEGYGQVGFLLERGGKGVGLRTGFHSIDNIHPLGFYSEGHLDSLGIAIFLAYMKRLSGNTGLLVLDDVMTTIDRDHRQRLAILLAEEFPDCQLILTTYDRLWAEELLTTLRAARLKVQALHLLPWSVQRGVEWQEFLEYQWNEYYQRAGTAPLSAVADTGRDLEKFLGMLRYSLQLSIPARFEDRYTIGDLYQPFFAWFDKRTVQHPTRDFKAEFEALKKELDVYWRYRNWAGAHYSAWGADLSPTEAQDFIDVVRRLVNLLSCPKCNSPVAYDERSGVLYCERCKGQSEGAFWRVVK